MSAKSRFMELNHTASSAPLDLQITKGAHYHHAVQFQHNPLHLIMLRNCNANFAEFHLVIPDTTFMVVMIGNHRFDHTQTL